MDPDVDLRRTQLLGGGAVGTTWPGYNHILVLRRQSDWIR
jgi:hypothetical protein